MWIARDANGELFLYNYKPHRYKGFFGYFIVGSSPDSKAIRIDENMFPEITWKRSPVECEIVFKTRTNKKEDNNGKAGRKR